MRAHASGGLSADIARLPELEPEIVVAELDASVVTAHLDPIDSADELALAPLLAMARSRLDPLGCDVVVRAFHPVSVPALHLDDRAARHERARAEAEAQANDLWAGILSSLRDTSARARLVLNYLNPLVRRIAALDGDELTGTAIESLYGQSLLMAGRTLKPVSAQSRVPEPARMGHPRFGRAGQPAPTRREGRP